MDIYLEQSLILQYPLLQKYIRQCFQEGKVDELLEFLAGIELEDQPVDQ